MSKNPGNNSHKSFPVEILVEFMPKIETFNLCLIC